MSKQSKSHGKFVWVVGVLIGCILLWIASLIFSVTKLRQALQIQEVTAVARHSRYLHLTTSAISWLTFRTVPSIESIDALLGIASKSDKAVTIISDIQSTASTESIDLRELLTLITSLESESARLEKNMPDCKICKKQLPPSVLSKIENLVPHMQAIHEIASHMGVGTHRYLVIFQNSDELRATGGFTGSYAVISIVDGVVQPIVIEDIYDADGQFTGKIPAPNGVAQYLSSDNGLRLPDANWDPHFPTSAKQILQFFALGERDNFEGVIALTDTYFEDLLAVIGPIWLPDYQLTVTPENLTSVLRTDRDDFFAGSIQKKHLLGQFQNQVVIALSQNENAFLQLMTITTKHMNQKNILAYSSHEELQMLFTKLGIDGGVFIHDAASSLAFVESNVGINKANQHINRELSLTSSGSSLTANYRITNTNKPPLTTELSNLVETQTPITTPKNQAKHLSYVNYQRVLYPAEWDITSLSVSGAEAVEQNSTTRVISPGKELTETGFLVVVPEQHETLVTITFNTKKPVAGTTLELYKQPGTNPLPVWLQKATTTPFNGEPTLILEKNTELIAKFQLY